MKKIVFIILSGLILLTIDTNAQSLPTVKMSKDELRDKIKGGWAGQTIGVVFGAPVEFKFTGGYIQDYQPISWADDFVKYWWEKKPGLFDDIYNDCTFVETLDKLGLDCSQEQLAHSFASADYHLAHANQAARYNIRHGIMPPASGYWENNPHADDIDFQIESDFIGLMTPALLPEAMKIASRVGHIMNSGDGFYGGAFVAGMYSAAFYEKNPEAIVKTALLSIPEESTFHQCIQDVINFHSLHPDNWKGCWYFLQNRWNCDVGCPKGVFLSFNIDAKINAAFVALAMLYGNGDYSNSLDIAARCGQDADCNPSTVGGVLGTMYGYKNIPSFWLKPLKEIENYNFEGTDMSLSKAYELSYKHAKEMILRAGGTITDTEVRIPLKKAEILPLEQNFKNTYPLCRARKDCFLTDTYDFDFKGNGFIIWGNICSTKHITPDYINRVSTRHIGSEVFGLAEPNDPYVAKVEVWIDGQLDQTSLMPMKNTERKLEPAWKYLLPEGPHHVTLKWINHKKNYIIRINDIVYYSEKKQHDRFYFNK
jgi:hypothetical protein